MTRCEYCPYTTLAEIMNCMTSQDEAVAEKCYRKHRGVLNQPAGKVPMMVDGRPGEADVAPGRTRRS